MLGKITLVSLLLVSSSVLAHTADDPQHAHQAYWRDHTGAPILDTSGNCVRTGSFVSLGSPSCYPPEEQAAATAESTPAPEAEEEVEVETEAEAEAEAAATTATEPEEVTEVANTEVTSVVADDTSADPVEERQAPATPKAEPVTSPQVVAENNNVVAQQVEPEQPAPAEPEVVTYSYPIANISTHIYFDFDKNNLKIAEQEKLEEVVIAARQAHKIVKVSVEGHADSRGTDEYNYALSQRRINTVVNYLNLRGIETNTTMAWGESQLIMFTDGSENYDHSRRAEVKVRIQKKVQN